MPRTLLPAFDRDLAQASLPSQGRSFCLRYSHLVAELETHPALPRKHQQGTLLFISCHVDFREHFVLSHSPLTSEKIVAYQPSCKMTLPVIIGHGLAKTARSADWDSVFCKLHPPGWFTINSSFSQGLSDGHRGSSPRFVTVNQQRTLQIHMEGMDSNSQVGICNEFQTDNFALNHWPKFGISSSSQMGLDDFFFCVVGNAWHRKCLSSPALCQLE